MKILFSRGIFLLTLLISFIVLGNSNKEIAASEKQKSKTKQAANITKINVSNSIKKTTNKLNSTKEKNKKTPTKTPTKKQKSKKNEKQMQNANNSKPLTLGKKNTIKKTIKNNINSTQNTYAGMVGDKRTSSGITLDLTTETCGKGCWMLYVMGKKIEDKQLVHSSFQDSKSRFLIDVNANILRDKVVNFTYRMPRDIRLKYGNQKNGYRITINLPSKTKIIFLFPKFLQSSTHCLIDKKLFLSVISYTTIAHVEF